MYSAPSSGLKLFIEFGFPYKYSNYSTELINPYPEHGIGTNIGLRKNGWLNKDEIIFGVEYTRLVQSIYYNLTVENFL